MWLSIFIGTAFLIGGTLGWMLGVLFLKRENTTILRQLELQKQFSEHWAAVAAGKEELSNKIANQQVGNVKSQMETVIQILQTFQIQQQANLNQEKKQQINTLIEQAKQIIPNRDIDSF